MTKYVFISLIFLFISSTVNVGTSLPFINLSSIVRIPIVELNTHPYNNPYSITKDITPQKFKP